MQVDVYFAGYTTFDGMPIEPSVTLDLTPADYEALMMHVDSGEGAFRCCETRTEGRTTRRIFITIPARAITRVEAVAGEHTEPELLAAPGNPDDLAF